MLDYMTCCLVCLQATVFLNQYNKVMVSLEIELSKVLEMSTIWV